MMVVSRKMVNGAQVVSSATDSLPAFRHSREVVQVKLEAKLLGIDLYCDRPVQKGVLV